MVNCEERFLRDKGVNIEENNTSVGSNGKSLDDFCNSELLQKYGLQSIPLQQMGPLNNRWIE